MRKTVALFAVVTLLAVGLPLWAADENEDQDNRIPLYEVPMEILKAAAKAVPGMSFEYAYLEVEDGVKIFELEGPTPDGQVWEVEVDEAGKVLEAKKAGDDDEDDDQAAGDDKDDD